MILMTRELEENTNENIGQDVDIGFAPLMHLAKHWI